MRRALASAALAVLLFAGAIARLRRAEVPRFEPVSVLAGGRVAVGRVVLARRGGPAGHLLGWAVTCGRREVVSLPGARELVALGEGPPGAARVRERATRRVATVDVASCAVRWGE